MRKLIMSFLKKKDTKTDQNLKNRNVPIDEIFGNEQAILSELQFLKTDPNNVYRQKIIDQKAQKQAFDKAFPVQEVKGYPNRLVKKGEAMDDYNGGSSIKPFFNQAAIPSSLSNWYASQSFIGFQNCAMLSQHWLIEKCCSMPAEDAVRKGYKISMDNGVEIPYEVLSHIKKMDKKYNLISNLIKFATKGRIFGLNVAFFDIETDDPDEFYFNPFNIDAVKPGSYRGIVQVDPQWIVGQLGMEGASSPDSMYFYEPEWWLVNGRRIHRTHVVVYRNGELPNVLKPSYFYGSVSIPQKIYQRVYCAERTANEAPLLCLTKRTKIYKTDMSKVMSQQQQVEQKIQNQVEYQNNYGVQVVDTEDEVQQLDTALADLDAVIMTQYQLVASAAEVPATKLLGNQPKGFNSTGEYEESSYHEMLESLQTHNLTPLLNRHYEILVKSEILPKFSMDNFDIYINWIPLDALTEQEQANINKIEAETSETYFRMGAFSNEEIRKKAINNPDSGFNGFGQNNEYENEDDENEDIKKWFSAIENN